MNSTIQLYHRTVDFTLTTHTASGNTDVEVLLELKMQRNQILKPVTHDEHLPNEKIQLVNICYKIKMTIIIITDSIALEHKLY